MGGGPMGWGQGVGQTGSMPPWGGQHMMPPPGMAGQPYQPPQPQAQAVQVQAVPPPPAAAPAPTVDDAYNRFLQEMDMDMDMS